MRERVVERIRREGPLPLPAFMELCVAQYYGCGGAVGGDFLTAPHVSQMFGELLGLWVVETWRRLGARGPLTLIELGPGEGLMLADALRAISGVDPKLAGEARVRLVEQSPALADRQTRRLAAFSPRRAATLTELDIEGPFILLANEFLDCLPAEQAERTAIGWRRRAVGLDREGGLAFVDAGPAPAERLGEAEGLPVGSVLEWSAAAESLAAEIGAMVARSRGAALFIDYGSAEEPPAGDTLQAVSGHEKLPALEQPGEADLTAHVRFAPFLAAARAAGAATSGPLDQASFLAALGLPDRAERLARANPDKAATIARQVERLTQADQMGRLFQACCIHALGLEPPGFAA